MKPNTETNKRKHTHRTQQDTDLEKHFLNRAKFAQEFEPASDKWIYTKLKTFIELRKQFSGGESLPAMHLIEDLYPEYIKN